MTQPTVKCSDCGCAIAETASEAAAPSPKAACPACGSIRRTVALVFSDSVEAHDSVAYKARREGEKKPIAWGRSGDDLTKSTGQWAEVSRSFDRENDLYRERVLEKATGKVLHECNEPLSQHTGHGSAKTSNKKSKT